MKAFLATRKGLIVLKQKGAGWDVEKAHFDGVNATYVTVDNQGWVWAGLNHGHWGPKLHVSKNKGKTFEEMAIPKFAEGSKDKLKGFWCVSRDSEGRIYVGTDPAVLFYSDDEGKSWEIVDGLYNMPGKDKWFGGGADGTNLHSILIDPNDDDHIVIGISVGGVIVTKNRGKTWQYSNKGLQANFMPDPNDEVVQDPHLLAMAPSDPKVLWQQNHCGIFKSENFGEQWVDLSKNKGIQSAFGWAVVVDEKDPKIAYTIPALSDETRVPIKKKLIVQKTTDGGKSWKTLSKGLPQKYCYDIIYRHSFSKIEKNLIFASTTGHVYFSKNSGAAWKQMKYQFSPVYALTLMK